MPSTSTLALITAVFLLVSCQHDPMQDPASAATGAALIAANRRHAAF